MRNWKMCVVAFATACNASLDADSGRFAVEPNPLGVTTVEIDHLVQADRVLEVHGFDAAGVELATLRLRTGLVAYSWDADTLPTRDHPGTELSITIDKLGTGTQIVPDLARHRLHTENPAVDELARIPAIASAIEHEAGILPPPRRADESAYTYVWSTMSCSVFASEFRNVTVPDCCLGEQDWYADDESGGFSSTFHATLVNATTHSYRYRNPSDLPCRASDGVTAAGNDAYYGPCKWALNQYAGGSSSGWFTVISGLPSCGMNTTGSGSGYGSVTGTCAYTGCDNGTPY